MDDATQKLAQEAWDAREATLFHDAPDEAKAFIAADRAGFLAGFEAAQRPPVSPEVREALVDTLTSPVRAPGSVAASRVFRAETPEDLEDATALADAILARFSLPVLDVEKVAAWLMENFQPKSPSGPLTDTGQGTWAKKATALVASPAHPDHGWHTCRHREERIMSKLDEVLDYLDSGYDRDIEWSERIGSRVFIHYRDGTELVVAAAMESGGSGS